MHEYGLHKISALLPPQIRSMLSEIPVEFHKDAEELRLRCGHPPSITIGRFEYSTKGACVCENDLRSVIELASHYSAHTVMDQIRGGYLTVQGGHRIGLCGEAITEEGRIAGFRRVSSINLRIAKELKGIAQPYALSLFDGDFLSSTLIIAPPGVGKTTFLRDLIRCVSSGISGQAAIRIGVADERGELSGMWEGKSQFDLGPHTDVIYGTRKGDGLIILLRGMNPQVLAVDEITHPTDLDAIFFAVGCGVSLLATAHGRHPKEMKVRPLYNKLLEHGIFRKAIIIEQKETGERVIRVEEIS